MKKLLLFVVALLISFSALAGAGGSSGGKDKDFGRESAADK